MCLIVYHFDSILFRVNESSLHLCSSLYKFEKFSAIMSLDMFSASFSPPFQTPGTHAWLASLCDDIFKFSVLSFFFVIFALQTHNLNVSVISFIGSFLFLFKPNAAEPL